MRAFYPVDFRDPAACGRAATSRDYPASRRAAVASILRRQAESWGLLEASRESLERFAGPDTIVVVSGQQPGLFGGPLYTLYKTLTGIAFARELERATGRPVVPIFWIASDDHDFEESRHAFLGDGGAALTEVAYPLDAVPRGVSLARVRLGDPVLDLLRGAEEALGSTAFRGDVIGRHFPQQATAQAADQQRRQGKSDGQRRQEQMLQAGQHVTAISRFGKHPQFDAEQEDQHGAQPEGGGAKPGGGRGTHDPIG